MPHRVDAPLSLAAAVVTLLAVLVIPGSTAWSGPVLLTLTPTHGVHLLDLGVVALGLALAVAVSARAWPAVSARAWPAVSARAWSAAVPGVPPQRAATA